VRPWTIELEMSLRSHTEAFPIPRTHAGRYLQSVVGTPHGHLLRAVGMHPRLAPLRKLVSDHPLKLVLVALLVRKLREKWKAYLERRKFLSLKPMEGPPKAPTGEAAAIPETAAGVPEIVLPSLRAMLANHDGSIMVKEATLSMLSSLVASLLMKRKAFLLGRLIALQNTDDWASWRYYASMFPLNAALVCLLHEFASYIKDRTVLNWRRNVTNRIHDLYFSHMGYYRLQNQNKGMMIPDPDIRLGIDINNMCTANGNLYFSIVNAAVYTAMFGSAVISGRDWKWSLLTPAFFFVALSSIVTSENWQVREPLQTALSRTESRFTQLLTRVQLHAERICMLQGEGFEENLLKGLVQKIDTLGQKLRWLMLKRDIADKVFFNQGWPTFLEQTAWGMGSFMGCNDVIKHTADKSVLPYDPRQPQSWASDHLGGQINNLWQFFNTCAGWGAFTTAWISLQSVEADTQRVRELYGSLNTLKKQSSKNNRVFHDEGPVVAFDNVTVATPTRVRLIEGLTVKVEEGQTLLICGHNGAGKSSIMRCLCGLWPVQQGTIMRPGGAVQADEKASLHQEMYYLPQKPCNVLGTLSDQLTYPEGRQLPEEELRRWLKYVDLEHLADRKIGKDASSRIKAGDGFNRQVSDDDDDDSNKEIDWEVLLSLGEQQALSIARLLYHRPRFAILDECTSAVGKVLERRLFEICREIGISCITITHRPTLKEHHARMLQLTGTLNKDGKGWKLTDLPSGVNLPPMKSRVKDNEELHRRIEAYLEKQRKGGASAVAECSEFELTQKRSAPYIQHLSEVDKAKVTAEDMVKARYTTSFQRLKAVLKLGMKDLEVRGRACRRLVLLVGFLVVRVHFGWMIWRSMAGSITGSICGDKPRVFAEIVGNLGSSLVVATMECLFGIVTNNLMMDIWQGTCTELQARAFRHATFLKVMNPVSSDVPVVENPIQRLCELRRPFEMLAEQVTSVALPLTNTIFLFPLMVDGVGVWAPLLLILNFCLFRGASLIAPDFAKIQRNQTMLESRFQVLHTRLRSISEPVAFSGAGHAERRIIEPRFNAVIEFNQSSLRKQFLYQATVNYFTDYGHLPIWTHRCISLKYASNTNPIDARGRGMAPCDVTANLLWDRCTQYSQVFIQRCVLFVPQWKRIDAQLVRALEMLVAFEAATKTLENQKLLDTSSPNVEQQLEESKSLISIRDLDLVTRRGVCLAKGITFDAKVGEPMLITGPNATGKSLLGNVLLGLWAASGENASVRVVKADGGRPPLHSIMPAPQRIYLPESVLFSCLSYPYDTQNHYHKLEAPFRMFVKNLPPNCTKDGLLEVFTPRGASGVDMVPDKEEGTPSTAAYVSFSRREDLGWILARPQDIKVLEQDVDIDYALYGEIAVAEQPGDGLARVQAERNARMQAPQISRMLACLRAVGIEHILTREEQGFIAERSWEDSLSGGEQQRLCFARVLYHKPIFGLLDECTSMVAADAEEKLYRSLFRDWDITPITLTQRMFMPDLYSKELSLGIRSADGWELADVSGTAQEGGAPSVDDMYCTVSSDMGLRGNVVSGESTPAKPLAMPSIA